MAKRLERTLRGNNVLYNIFEMWVGLAGIISGCIFFYSPASIDGNAVAITVGHDLAAFWNVSYFLAGIGIWVGLLRPSPRWEIAGLCILGSATAIQGIAIIYVFGLRGLATAVTLLALTAASWVRGSFVFTSAIRLAKENTVAARGNC